MKIAILDKIVEAKERGISKEQIFKSMPSLTEAWKTVIERIYNGTLTKDR